MGISKTTQKNSADTNKQTHDSGDNKSSSKRVIHKLKVVEIKDQNDTTDQNSPSTDDETASNQQPQHATVSAIAERSKKRPAKILVANSDAKSIPTDTIKQKPISSFVKSKINTISKKTTPRVTANHQEVTNNQDMKLPLLRRIHIKPCYIVLGILLLLLAGFIARVAIWEHNYILAKEGSERDTTTSINTGADVYEGGQEVDNTKPTEKEIVEYHVAADKPRYLTIRSIGIYNARVVEIGLKNNGEVGTPYNIYDVGWYVDSALPGSNGVSLIDAHGGDLGYGIFRNLPKINIGDQIIIEMGDETTKYTYNVVDISFQDLGDAANAYMSTALTSPEPGKPSLTLITCTGEWWEQSQTYSQRLFVRAVLQQ